MGEGEREGGRKGKEGGREEERSRRWIKGYFLANSAATSWLT